MRAKIDQAVVRHEGGLPRGPAVHEEGWLSGHFVRCPRHEALPAGRPSRFSPAGVCVCDCFPCACSVSFQAHVQGRNCCIDCCRKVHRRRVRPEMLASPFCCVPICFGCPECCLCPCRIGAHMCTPFFAETAPPCSQSFMESRRFLGDMTPFGSTVGTCLYCRGITHAHLLCLSCALCIG